MPPRDCLRRVLLLAFTMELTGLPLLGTESTEEQKSLERMQASRVVDGQNRSVDQEAIRVKVHELSETKARQAGNIESLKAANVDAAGAYLRERQASQTYHKALDNYGPNNSESVRAKSTLEDARQSRRTNTKARQDLQSDIKADGRAAHNEKTMLDQQQRRLTSRSRYIAANDRTIEKKKRHIAAQKNNLPTK